MSVRNRGGTFQVVYRCPGESSPRTESYKSEDEAIIRDMQIKLAKKNGTFKPPERTVKGVVQSAKKEIKVREFLDEYVAAYGLKKWGHSYYSACLGLIRNYIIPYIGDCWVRTITVKDMDRYYSMLLEEPAVVQVGRMNTGAKVTAHTIMRIHKLLKSAFGKAVVWEYADINPTLGVTLPEYKSKAREVWSDAEAIRALNVCDNPVLRICLYLALGCSLRIGEILGLQWGQVHIDNFSAGEAYIKIDRELKRCTNESIQALETVNRSAIYFKFPAVIPKQATTRLVLKAPKTESSNRIIYLPQAVVEELRKVKKQQEEYRKLLGSEYQEFDLVVAQINGRPYEQRIIDKLFARLIRENDLRPVVFHSLRHCSISLMLKLSGGDVKAVQGNSGHAESRMVTDTYAHSFDTDRKLLAQEIDTGFFAKLGEQQKTEEPDAALLDKLKLLIRDNPKLVQALLANANNEM